MESYSRTTDNTPAGEDWLADNEITLIILKLHSDFFQ